MNSHFVQSLPSEVIKDVESFLNLKEEWEDLYQNSTGATPFQSWAWLYSWWENYGEGYELRLITVRSGDLLVGLIPLMLERWWGFPGWLSFIGTGLTDHLDILARKGWETHVVKAAVETLRRLGPWKLVDLHQLSPEAGALSICRKWPGRRTYLRQPGYGCPVIDAKPLQELLECLSSNLRSTVRRTLRRAEKDGVVCKVATVESIELAARRVVSLHRETWRGRGISAEHLTERFESHIVMAASRMMTCGLGGISEFWRDGEVIASHFLLFGRDFVAEYLSGATQEALQRYQVSSLNIWDGLNLAHRRDAARVNLLTGEEPYKLRWASEVIPYERVILSSNPAFGSTPRSRARPPNLLARGRLRSYRWS
jgi:CelD/BcsL family acetyltransferase involved in cellulose biosynthesis